MNRVPVTDAADPRLSDYVALRDTFDAGERQLHELVRTRRGEVKPREGAAPHSD